MNVYWIISFPSVLLWWLELIVGHNEIEHLVKYAEKLK